MPLAAVARLAFLALLLALHGCTPPRLPPDPYELHLERGEVALSLGDTEDAADAYRGALLFRPEGPEALHGLARALLARDDGEGALDVFGRLATRHAGYLRVEAAGDYARALDLSARASMGRGDSATALRLLRRRRQLVPTAAGDETFFTRVLIVEGGRLQVAGREGEARALYREAVGAGPEERQGALGLAQRLLDAGDTDLAISVLSNALLRHPQDPELLGLLNRCLQIRYPDGLY